MASTRWLKAGVFLAGLAPLGVMAGQALTGTLGANPPDALTDRTGEWALRILLVTLVITPLRRATGWRWPGRIRRMVGLFAFFYGLLHFAAYAAFDQSLRLPAIWADLWERPFITVGFVALAGLLPLTLTSTRAAMMCLGPWWSRLHQTVYLWAILSVLHFYLLVKADIREPLVYSLILAFLLGYRMLPRRWQRSPLRGLKTRSTAARF
jgi:sulfoxide reductase heme-binding subunit YedZ